MESIDVQLVPLSELFAGEACKTLVPIHTFEVAFGGNMDWLFPWSLVCLDQSANSRQLSFSPTRTILAGVDANVRLFRWGWWCTREGVGE
jgi:hypothetical protein